MAPAAAGAFSVGIQLYWMVGSADETRRRRLNEVRISPNSQHKLNASTERRVHSVEKPTKNENVG